MLNRVTAPADSPVTLAEAKAHLHVDHSDEDTLIQLLIEAATDYVDGPYGFLGRALIDQTWDYYADAFPDGAVYLPLPPLIEIEGVYYLSGGAEAEFTDYVLDEATGRLTGTWPTADDETNAVRIRFRAGYLDTSVSPATANVPASIRAAILIHVADLYENRESQVAGTVNQLPWSAEQLLRRYRYHLALA